jgi:hypothetical protein
MTDFQNILVQLKDYILTNVPQFGVNGYVIDPGNDNSFKGLTDAIDEYFYLDFQDGSRQVEYDQIEDALNVYFGRGNMKIVARTKKYTAASMADVLFACIENFADDCSIQSDIDSVTTDESFIFMQETEEEIPKDMCLVLINFGMIMPVNKKKQCVELVCKKPLC